ncbi:hypothetical protein [Paenibacillus wynnii]|uniref:hypothetical protein n=1 Tax=Paenibacillus wynnii TaxID=268407 RepID=UPI000AE3E69C
MIVSPFYIDPTAVTNEQFAYFIKETHYITDASVSVGLTFFTLLFPKRRAGR